MNRVIVKLTCGDLIFGVVESADSDTLILKEPYSVYQTETTEVAVMPYEYPLLMEPMKEVSLRVYDIMWDKPLSDFPQVEKQYISATSGIVSEEKQNIII